MFALQLSNDYSNGLHGPIGSWDVSTVTDMRYMFYGASSFNGDLSKWDVSSVTTMERMFYGASSFNGDLSKWDVSSVTTMRDMFYRASSFAQTLCGAWSTSKAVKNNMFSFSPGRLCLSTSTSKTTSIKPPTLTLTSHNPGYDP